MFGKEYWEKFKSKMLHHIQKLDPVFIRTVDENIKWWERNEKLEKVSEKIDSILEKVEAKEKIAKLPLTNNEDFDKETLDKKTWEVKEWLRDSVREQKETIHYLKSTNKSKEALMTSRKLQMIFQDPISSLNPRMTVQEIVGEGLTILGGYSKTEIKEKVGEVLELVGLSREYAARYPHEFSGGQRQRIGVARALIMNPDFIIADEPISALDVSIRAQVINLLTELKESLGLTILFIAHDLSVVQHISDRVAVMYLGKMMEIAATADLYDKPRHPYTTALLSAVPLPDPRSERTRERIILTGDLPSPINPPSGCRFRTRCWKAQEVCTDKAPELLKVGSSNVACHFPE